MYSLTCIINLPADNICVWVRVFFYTCYIIIIIIIIIITYIMLVLKSAHCVRVQPHHTLCDTRDPETLQGDPVQIITGFMDPVLFINHCRVGR